MSRCWYHFVQNSCWLVTCVLFRFRILGSGNIPLEGPVLVLANHQSYLDPILVGVASRRKFRFLARKTLFFWPFSWLISSLGATPIDRKGSGIAGVRATLKILKQGEGVVLFPEGTRSKDGNLQPLKPGFCAIAKRSSAPILPIGIAGSFLALPYGKICPRLKPVVLQFGEPIELSEMAELNDDELQELVTVRIAKAYHQAADHLAG